VRDGELFTNGAGTPIAHPAAHEPAGEETTSRRLRRRAWNGAAWSSLECVGGNVIGGVFFLILVRLLTPEIFGLMAAAAVFLAAADILMEQGLGKAVIQREHIRPDHLDTAFWAQVGIGILVCALGVVAAPSLAALYRRPELVPVIRVILLVIPLSALSAMQEALLLRSLNFKTTAKRRLCADLAGGFTAVALAVAGYGVWALVAQKVVEQAAGVILLWSSSAWRPGFAVTWTALRELTEFSIHLFFQRGLDVVKRRADQFLIGVYLGPAALGLYAMAVRAVTIVIELFVRTFAKFSLPLFARLQTADDALKRAYEASVFAGALYGLPAACSTTFCATSAHTP
jgi:O-antigen/teichoic acid export membrane protein